MAAAATASTTIANLTIDADGALVLTPTVLRAIRPEGERLTLLDIDVGNGTLTMRRSTIDQEDWWAYTPEHIKAIEQAKNSPSYRIAPSELEALIVAEDPQAALAALLQSKRDEPVK